MTQNSQEKMEKFPLNELLKGIPGLVGIQLDEEPNYKVLEKMGDVEIREYPASTRASTEVQNGDFKEVTGQAFVKLANYIFIKNKKHETMSMTSPVLLRKIAAGWKMSFFLPEQFSGDHALAPEDTLISLESVPPRTYAVLKYSGNMTEELLEEKNQELKREIEKSPKLKILGPPTTAQYDQPFSVPFLKKNETWIPVSYHS